MPRITMTLVPQMHLPVINSFYLSSARIVQQELFSKKLCSKESCVCVQQELFSVHRSQVPSCYEPPLPTLHLASPLRLPLSSAPILLRDPLYAAARTQPWTRSCGSGILAVHGLVSLRLEEPHVAHSLLACLGVASVYSSC